MGKGDESGSFRAGLGYIGEHRIESGVSGFGLQLAADVAGRIGARFFFRGEEGILTAVVVWGKPAAAVA